MEDMIVNAVFGFGTGCLLGAVGFLKSYTQSQGKEVFMLPKFALTACIGGIAGIGITVFGLAPEQAVTLVASLAGVTVVGQDALKAALSLYLKK